MSSPHPPRLPELRHDPIFNRWVIFSPARARRPSDLKSQVPASDPNPNPTSCPFCLGNEHQCAPEIFRIPNPPAPWQIRVIQNLYPALNRDLTPTNMDMDDQLSIPGVGFHDVVIETPHHSIHLVDLSGQEVGEVILAYKERILQLAGLGFVKYVQVFKNYGKSAGASMSHSHSQIMGLPLVPPAVSARMGSMKEWFERSGRCVLCDAGAGEVLVDETNHFFGVVPVAASFPFEIWIVPREHCAHFHEIDREKAVDLGGLLKLILQKLSKQLNDPPFNFMIHTAHLELPALSLPCVHWFLQIVPQLTVIGGFEVGTGCYINPIFPEDAAKVLREVMLPRS